ncbi:MAG: HdeD family acid-resistance protein [Polyangiaceae bacterium]|nr:HdeD family acid-resistance protein [Polyangiaceae bacterium]
MNPERYAFDPNESAMAAPWWLTVLRGVLAVLFGILALARPSATATALVILFAAWAIIDGGFALGAAAHRGRSGLRWGWFLIEGLVSIAAGVIAIVYPAITVLVLIVVVAVRALALGIFEIAQASTGEERRWRWLQAITGVVSFLFGILLLWHPVVGALTLIWTIGIYALIFGVMTIGLGFHMLGQQRGGGDFTRHAHAA